MTKTIDQGRVDIWISQPSQTTDAIPSEWLNNEELARLNRYRSASKQQQFLEARVFLKKTLSRYISLESNQWHFTTGQYGKPEIDWVTSGLLEDPQLSFNLSHSQNCLVLAVTQVSPVGIDVESLARPRPWPKLAKRVCTKQEQADLNKLEETRQFSHFIKLWAHKEAVLKAMGLGINSQWPMNQLGFVQANQGQLTFMQPSQFPHTKVNLYGMTLGDTQCAVALLDFADEIEWNINTIS